MSTKLDAAKICMNSGCHMAIANGKHINPLDKLVKKIFALGSCQKYQVLMQEKNGL